MNELVELGKAFAEHGLPGLVILVTFIFVLIVVKRVFDILAEAQAKNEERFNAAQQRHEERVDDIMDKHKGERDEWRDSVVNAINSLTQAVNSNRQEARQTDESPYAAQQRRSI